MTADAQNLVERRGIEPRSSGLQPGALTTFANVPMVQGQGFEPRLQGSEPRVLPVRRTLIDLVERLRVELRKLILQGSAASRRPPQNLDAEAGFEPAIFGFKVRRRTSLPTQQKKRDPGFLRSLSVAAIYNRFYRLAPVLSFFA